MKIYFTNYIKVISYLNPVLQHIFSGLTAIFVSATRGAGSGDPPLIFQIFISTVVSNAFLFFNLVVEKITRTLVNEVFGA